VAVHLLVEGGVEMLHPIRIAVGIAALWLLTACTGIGILQHATQTETQLTRKNFRILKSSVRGESTGFALLLGLIPIVPATYTEAMTALHEGADIEGKAAALANVAQDSTQLNLILFTVPRVTITADVVEFLE
jgi:hypothetical protein